MNSKSQQLKVIHLQAFACFVFLLCIAIGPSGIFASELQPIELDYEKSWNQIAPSSFVLVDPSKEMQLDAANQAWEAGKFVRENQEQPNYGFTAHAYWFRFSAHSSASLDRIWYFGLESPLVKEIDLYIQESDGSWQRREAGSMQKFDKRDLKNRFFYLKVNFAKDEIKQFMLRVHTDGSSEFTMLFRELSSIYTLDHDSQYFLGSVMGLLLVLACYYLLITLVSRQLDTFWLAIFLLALFLLRMSLLGLGLEYLWSNSLAFAHFIMVISIPFVFGSSLAVGYVFFPMFEYPRLRRIMQVFLFLNWTAFAIAAFLPYNMIKFYTMLGILTALLTIFTSFYSQYRGFRPARFFAYAWTTMLCGAIGIGLQKLGIIPVSFFGTYGLELATIILVILMSLGVSDKIKEVNQALVKAQADALKMQIETNRLQLVAQQADQRALEEQLRLNALKDQFLANTSHELRTPLTGMVGMAEAILQRKNLDSRDQGDLKAMLDASLRLSRLVSDILDFSIFQDLESQIVLSDLNAEKQIHATLALLKPLIQDKKIEFEFHFAADGSWIKAHPEHLAKVFNAILSNAIKFTEAGLISIHSRFIDNSIEIAIADHGCGIAANKLKNIEGAFEQADGGSTRKQGGTGLGLALAFRLMKAQGASLQVYSQINVGTTVVMRFAKAVKPLNETDEHNSKLEIVTPIQSVANLEQKPPIRVDKISKPPATLDNPPIKKFGVIPLPLSVAKRSKSRPVPRILVVDDDALNRRVLASHLEKSLFEIEFAESGPEALEKVSNSKRFDLILLDVMMPGMSGYEVCQELRKTYESVDLPILMLTAKNQVQDVINGFSSGANDYIQKPFHQAELHARINVHLKMGLATKAMKRFVPEDFIRLLDLQHFSEVDLGDAVERNLTILFADIRGFTKAAESMATQEVFQYLNNCFAILGPEIRNAGGFIDKYIGDAIMAIFPVNPEDAIKSVVAMNLGLESLQETYWLGTGIHIGPTMLGTLGEPERFETTALSDAVNVSARLESLTKLLDVRVIVSEDCKNALGTPETWNWRHLGLVLIKGREQAINIYELLDVNPNRETLILMTREFEDGVLAFREQKFMQALLHFQHVLRKLPLDGPSLIYVNRLKELLVNSDGFFGILDLTDKR